jgi:hypothetical protein
VWQRLWTGGSSGGKLAAHFLTRSWLALLLVAIVDADRCF